MKSMSVIFVLVFCCCSSMAQEKKLINNVLFLDLDESQPFSWKSKITNKLTLLQNQDQQSGQAELILNFIYYRLADQYADWGFNLVQYGSQISGINNKLLSSPRIGEDLRPADLATILHRKLIMPFHDRLSGIEPE